MSRKKGFLERWRQHTLGNQALVITSVLVTISSFIYTGTTIYQARMFKRNAEETGRQTDKLVNASERLANTSAAQVSAMQGQLNAMQEQANALQGSLEETRKVANASTAQANSMKQLVGATASSARAAEQSIQVARQSFYIKERPYLVISEFDLTDYAIGKNPTIQLEIMNTGNTPAIKVELNTYVEVRHTPLPIHPTYAAQSSPPSQIYMPAFNRQIQIVSLHWALTPELMEGLERGELFFYVFGVGRYDDRLGVHHTLKFCRRYSPPTDTFEACPYHNEEN
ncbi:MAG: hypothetical protein ACJ741_09395 [Pyrinomonadaceae bacterium]